MGTLVALYVRADDPATAKLLLDEYALARTEPGMGFYEVRDPSFDYDPPEGDLRGLSARLRTDVIWLAFQSVVDAFQFHHWRDGVRLRSLVNGCREESTWERIEGEPEPWEHAAIVAPEPPVIRLTEDGDEAEDGNTRVLRFAVGEWDPLNARKVARKVAEFYRLPGWWLGSDDA